MAFNYRFYGILDGLSQNLNGHSMITIEYTDVNPDVNPDINELINTLY